MALGKDLRKGWIHLFIPRASVEYMAYAYVPGTALEAEVTENKNIVPGLKGRKE